MRLILLGLDADRERLEEIAARLGRFGHEVSFRAFGGDLDESERNVEDVPTEAPEFVWVLHCWTFASVSEEGRAFQASAVADKQAGDYHGLICDPVGGAKSVAFTIRGKAKAEGRHRPSVCKTTRKACAQKLTDS